MEYPQGSSVEGESGCLLLNDVPSMTKTSDAECENEFDSLGYRLGDGDRLAVYHILGIIIIVILTSSDS